jgi:hypothetical protein
MAPKLLLGLAGLSLVASAAVPGGASPPSAAALHAQPCADLDASGYVGDSDHIIMQSHFGWSGPPGTHPADLNSDGIVAGGDFFIFFSLYGTPASCQDTPIGPDPVESVSQMVGPGGGNVGTGNTDIVEASLHIPPGALAGSTPIEIDALAMPVSTKPLALPHVPVNGNKPFYFRRIYDFSPDGLVLNQPATLTMSYQEAALQGSNEGTLGVIHLENEEWEYIPVIARDTINNTITVQINSFSIYGIYEPVVTDTDSDGCLDAEEQQTAAGSQLAGGLRNPVTYWDFSDTPTGGSFTLDSEVGGLDFFAVLARYGAMGDPNDDPLAAVPPPPAYHVSYDHTNATTPPDDVWDTGPPNGSIGGTDFFSILASFGHKCLL